MKVFDFYSASCETIMKKHYKDSLSENEYKMILENSIRSITSGEFSSPQDAVEHAVNVLFLEKENKEFHDLLKHIVKITATQAESVHVIINKNSFKLVDDEGNRIQSEYLEEFVAEMIDNEVGYEDLLISALMTIAPKTITLHTNNRNCTYVKTIEEIFEGKVRFCDHCDLCDLCER